MVTMLFNETEIYFFFQLKTIYKHQNKHLIRGVLIVFVTIII